VSQWTSSIFFDNIDRHEQETISDIESGTFTDIANDIESGNFVRSKKRVLRVTA